MTTTYTFRYTNAAGETTVKSIETTKTKAMLVVGAATLAVVAVGVGLLTLERALRG